MKKILILGAGMVVRPIVKYLLKEGYHVTVATRTKSKAEKMIDGHENGTALAWTVDDKATLDRLIEEHDLAVSLLPYAYHLMVAKHCIRHKKNMVTTSYVKPEMKALDQEARDAGIIILNEIGLDPGIDHMSAMRIIDHVHEKGGKIEEFYSITGALPEKKDNPFNYKFSWSPKGVILASKNDAHYLKRGEEKYISPKDLFKDVFSLDFPKVGELQVYPNRDSMPYIDLYSIPESSTMFRGTFRHPGWCESLDAIKALNLIDDEKKDYSGKTYAEFLAMQAGLDTGGDLKKQLREEYLEVTDHAIEALEWLGLFDEKDMGRGEDTAFEITSDIMIAKMEMDPDEKDMVVMQHTFLASYPDGKKEVIKSSMLDYGTLSTDTAVARTVALPAAMAVEMILKGEITETGVHIPVIPGIYNPVLDQLERKENIKMVEEFGLPESENINQ
ncbi:MAG: saccharopine dehydrogenase NADP-binding domain-containing protein [Bacteroidales bacterium]|nr:saccharopine dehydrogenase NADP-binding domain-containing protein [Bacteroidales bacterium]MCF8388098.1 saccharopine dehydrogenase NADP-binding domain-containing protein [Bacteroidales bacterium]MCF8398481.1 saccharopine dehydrogenase NADP-binding domain-containing protein [Bacteroidales bacterium]